MAIYSDFSAHNYQILEQLGVNKEGGRLTYKALNIQSQQTVVIKQFKFVSSDSDWSGYKAVEQELQCLKSLNHSQIPEYLDYFESEEGICLVQEYKSAPNLSQCQSFDFTQIKTITLNILKILVYLQQQSPSIIHRDIKPENILVDDNLNTYLVDFGLAKVDSQDHSSTVSGTIGFMPPEQFFNKPLSTASDLYSLGITLISLILGKESNQVSDLIDSQFQVDLSAIAPKVSPEFQNWLEKMVALDREQRFPDAETALDALQPIILKNPKEIELNHCEINLEATESVDIIEKELSLAQLIPEEVSEGKWEVAPHSSDPPHTPQKHAWIEIQPKTFSEQEKTEVPSHLRVDTSKLKSDQEYERKLLLHTNAYSETYVIPLRVKTAPLTIPFSSFPLYGLGIILVSMGGLSALTYSFDDLILAHLQQIWAVIVSVFSDFRYTVMTDIVIVIGVLVGIASGGSIGEEEKKGTKKFSLTEAFFGTIFLALFYGAIAGSVSVLAEVIWKQFIVSISLPSLYSLVSFGFFNAYVSTDATLIAATISLIIKGFYHFYLSLNKAGLNSFFAILFLIATVSLGILAGIEIVTPTTVESLSFIMASISGGYLISAILYLPLIQFQKKRQLKKQEINLIQP